MSSISLNPNPSAGIFKLSEPIEGFYQVVLPNGNTVKTGILDSQQIDVSELQVTSFKDQIDWRTGQEAELQSKLRGLIDSGEYPMLKMAQNYRSTAKTPAAKNTVKRSMEDTTNAIQEAFGKSNISELLKPIIEEAFTPTN